MTAAHLQNSTITPLIVICRTQGVGRIQAQTIVDRLTTDQAAELVTAYQAGNLPKITAICQQLPKPAPDESPAESQAE